ncbi:hypothetical protein [Serratia marcescens]|uniref:hypothetical protein n=1 Tax=Serratia marcescens TaxID=615 RepID=UPI000AEC754F|nr:hypothetical protein [Serratia marcescens]
MSQIKIDALGLIELLESSLAQITALANVAHYTLKSSNKDSSIYINDVSQLLLSLYNISKNSEEYVKEIKNIIN